MRRSLSARDVFADTVYCLALVDGRDDLHQRAVEWSRSLAAERVRVITTEFILVELANACSGGHLRSRVGPLVDAWRPEDLIPATTELFRAGLQLFDRRPDKHWSLTDCTSFLVMEEQGLTRALTLDRHFEQAGFEALLARDP